MKDEIEKINKIKAAIPAMEGKLETIIKQLFTTYNFLLHIPIKIIRNADLARLKPIIETLRTFPCPLAHNDTRASMQDSRRQIWIEMHHTIFNKIRRHIPDMQDGKVPLNTDRLMEHIQLLAELTESFIAEVLEVELHQNFYARMAFYKFHTAFAHTNLDTASAPRGRLTTLAHTHFDTAPISRGSLVYPASNSTRKAPPAFNKAEPLVSGKKN